MPAGEDRTIEVHVACDLAAMGAARATVIEAVGAWGFPALGELEIVVSELLTNAIRHAGTAAVVTCSLDDAGGVDVAVADSSATAPLPRSADDVATSGRGLAIVEALSDAWGTQVAGDGKTVWAHLSPSPA